MNKKFVCAVLLMLVAVAINLARNLQICVSDMAGKDVLR